MGILIIENQKEEFTWHFKVSKNSQDLIFRTLTFMEGQQYLISIGYIAELTEQPFIEQLIQNVLMKEVQEHCIQE